MRGKPDPARLPESRRVRRHTKPPRRQAYGNHQHRVENCFDHGRPSVGLDDGQHTDAGTRVVVAIEPRNRHEVRELPDEKDGEEGDAGPLDAAARRGPAQHGPHGAGERADEVASEVTRLSGV